MRKYFYPVVFWLIVIVFSLPASGVEVTDAEIWSPSEAETINVQTVAWAYYQRVSGSQYFPYYSINVRNYNNIYFDTQKTFETQVPILSGQYQNSNYSKVYFLNIKLPKNLSKYGQFKINLQINNPENKTFTVGLSRGHYDYNAQSTAAPQVDYIESSVEIQENNVKIQGINDAGVESQYLVITVNISPNDTSVVQQISLSNLQIQYSGSIDLYQEYILGKLSGIEQDVFDAGKRLEEDQKQEATNTGNSSVDEVLGNVTNLLDTGSIIDALKVLVDAMSYTGTECKLQIPSIDIPLSSGNIHILDSMIIDVEQWLDLFFKGEAMATRDNNNKSVEAAIADLKSPIIKEQAVWQITPWGSEKLLAKATELNAVGGRLDLSVVLSAIRVINTILLLLAVLYTTRNLIIKVLSGYDEVK